MMEECIVDSYSLRNVGFVDFTSESAAEFAMQEINAGGDDTRKRGNHLPSQQCAVVAIGLEGEDMGMILIVFMLIYAAFAFTPSLARTFFLTLKLVVAVVSYAKKPSDSRKRSREDFDQPGRDRPRPPFNERPPYMEERHQFREPASHMDERFGDYGHRDSRPPAGADFYGGPPPVCSQEFWSFKWNFQCLLCL